MIDYILKRSRRKTLTARVREDGTVEVSAPLNLDKKFIDDFVNGKEEILRKYINSQLEKNRKKQEFKIEIGSRVLFMGRELAVCEGNGNIEIKDGRFYVQNFNVKEQVKALYKGYARKILSDKVKKYSNIMKLYPKEVKINSAKTRWGSCSNKGVINFSWLLVMANEAAIDYVVIHELSHLKHMNHSRDFWRLVGQYEPDYKKRREELKRLAERLGNEDWV